MRYTRVEFGPASNRTACRTLRTAPRHVPLFSALHLFTRTVSLFSTWTARTRSAPKAPQTLPHPTRTAPVLLHRSRAFPNLPLTDMERCARRALLLACAGLACAAAPAEAALGELVFRCPSCTAERQAACPALAETCAEMVREPGCGCCPVCARREGEPCGVYTPRCSGGLRCYPTPGSELPLEQLVRGLGTCARKVELGEPGVGSEEQRETSAEVLDPSEASQTEVPPLRRPTKDDPKKNAVWQHRQEIRTKMKSNKADDVRPPPVKLTQCQQELDHVLERIARMPFSESRGPLEELYALHIPNCDKRGQYNVKQCKMSVHGQRGECWCVNPHTGRQIATSPMVRGDPNCGQHLGGPDMEPPAPLQK
ncbi:insulin-like growth factor-binding protein 2-A [Scleropages formosus]|uniref:insulin-like growth factor-binding protein 2-A n=1 Tax=Scleropages formosus TaxID=113540 RepID=UPI0010FAA7C8|nr:insulin-like growth factor-binding protein 2-A [Scleropages formosus]